MTARSLSSNEIERFLIEPTVPENFESTRKFFNMQLATGETRPEWCFVLDTGERFDARVLFMTYPGCHPEYGIMFHAFAPEMQLAGRAAFIREAMKMMYEHNGASIFSHEARMNSPRYQDNVELFTAAGFSPSSVRTLYKLDLTSRTSFTPLPADLVERSVADVGEEAFLRGFVLITSDTLDTEDHLRIETFGTEGAARNFFTLLNARDTSLERWKLYYTSGGEFVGLSVPQFLSETLGTIGYLGIAPQFRSKSYAGAILAASHKLLLEAGATSMLDEHDVLNLPAKSLLERAGYIKEYDKEHWKLTMESISSSLSEKDNR